MRCSSKVLNGKASFGFSEEDKQCTLYWPPLSCIPPPNLKSASPGLSDNSSADIYVDPSLSQCKGGDMSGPTLQIRLSILTVIVGQEESTVGNGNHLATLDTFGPTFAFSLDLWLPKFSFGFNGGLFGFQCDSSDDDLFISDMTYNGGTFNIVVRSGGVGWWPTHYNYPVQEWFNVFMTLYKEPIFCSNVKVWAFTDYYPAIGAKFKNFIIY